jgi:hypothetical protein
MHLAVRGHQYVGRGGDGDKYVVPGPMHLAVRGRGDGVPMRLAVRGRDDGVLMRLAVRGGPCVRP